MSGGGGPGGGDVHNPTIGGSCRGCVDVSVHCDLFDLIRLPM